MYAVIVREEYTRHLQIYNRSDPVDSQAAGWESAVLPAFLGIYCEESKADALLAAAGTHGIELNALFALEI